MSSRKSERLLNLLILLLVQRHFITKERIRGLLYAQQSNDAFEKMFERDKDELRSLGVPIEVGALDEFFGDELGYRIKPEEFALPEISFTADEAAVVSVATKVWEHSRLAGVATDAVRKLVAEGTAVDRDALEMIAPRVDVEEPSFEVFWDATLQRYPVTFEYGRPGAAVDVRRLEPWRVVRSAGRWYVVGNDLDKQAPRVFRLSRVRGEVASCGAIESYQIPQDLELDSLIAAPGRDQPKSARVLLRAGSGAPLRRRATQTVLAAGATDWDELELADLGVEEALSFGASLQVLAPDELKAELIRRLQAAREQVVQ